MKNNTSTNKQYGFTLVELVVVAGIVLVLGLIFTDVLVQTLRGENKVKLLIQVRQNGQTLLDRLINEMRVSEKIFCINDDNADTDTIVLFKEGVYTRYRFTQPLPAANPTNNGYISVESWNFLIDSYAACNNPELNPSRLTNDDGYTGISLSFYGGSGYTDRVFNRNTSPGFTDSVTIKFKAFAGVRSGTAYETTVAEGGVPFSTNVSLRSYR